MVEAGETKLYQVLLKKCLGFCQLAFSDAGVASRPLAEVILEARDDVKVYRASYVQILVHVRMCFFSCQDVFSYWQKLPKGLEILVN